MALDNYDGLKTEVAGWLNREDLALVIPTFVRLLEAQVERILRVREMLVRAEGELSDEFTTLPQDFLAIEHIVLVGVQNPKPLEWVPMNQINALQAESSPGRPTHFSIIGDEIELSPLPAEGVVAQIAYYRAIPKLSDTQPVNWLLTRHPDLYLYGTLMQAAPYLKNDERIGTWTTALAAILEDIRLADERAIRGGAPLKMRFKPY